MYVVFNSHKQVVGWYGDVHQDRTATPQFEEFQNFTIRKMLSRNSVLTSMINDCLVFLNLFMFLLEVLEVVVVAGGQC